MKRFIVCQRAPQAFSLVEVTLALGIAVFCLVVVFGLLTVGLNTSAISVEQTNAVNLLSVVANDLRTASKPFPQGSATPSSDGFYDSPIYQLPVPTPVPMATPSPTPTAYGTPTQKLLDQDGHPVNPSDPTARYQLNVWLRPGVGRDATVARIMLSWPASAAYLNPSGSVETLVALDRN